MKEQGVMSGDELQALLNRLQVTMRGLDIRSTRPNAILLLSNQAAEASETVANTLAVSLFGDVKRVVTIDLSRMLEMDKSSVSRIVVTLDRHGYLNRNPATRKYRLGAKLLDLASATACGLRYLAMTGLTVFLLMV